MSLYDKEKEFLIKTSQELFKKGYLIATGGNLSIRTDDSKAFVITPTNFDYMLMTIEDVCVMDFDMKKIEGKREPSIESGMQYVLVQL